MLGDVVRAHRRRLGLSQEELAAKSGISVRGVRKIETSRTDTPRPVTVRLLAEAFGLAGVERDRFCEIALGATNGPGIETKVAATLPAGGSNAAWSSAPDLVGRKGELAELDSAAAAAASGAFQIMWISGEAGAGKSALVAALASMLARRGWTTAWGGSPEVEGTPATWAWTDIVGQLMSHRITKAETAAVADLTDRLRPLLDGETPGPSGTTIKPFWVARAVVEFLRRSTDPLQRQSRPVLVLLDDVHRAGEETLQILRYAFSELADRSVLVAATYRPTEVSAALEAARAALVGPRVDQIDLAGLGEADVGRLLQARIGAVIAADVVELISARTGGNPLFVGETARLIAAEGLQAVADVVPIGVGNVLRRRLAGLPRFAQAVLRTAAVIGIEAETDVLLALDPTATNTVLDALEAAIHARLLTERAPGSVQFTHVLVRDTLYQDIPQVRRAHLHAQVLTALEQTHPGDIAALAHHALASATPATALAAVTRATAAAHAASTACAHSEAAALLTRALGILDLIDRQLPAPTLRNHGELVDTDGLRLDLLCALVSAQGHTGNVRAALTTRGRAVQVAGRLGDNQSLARAHTAGDAPALWALRESPVGSTTHAHLPGPQPDKQT